MRLKLCGTTSRTAIARRPSSAGMRAGRAPGSGVAVLIDSLHVDVSVPDDFPPFFGLALQVGREFVRRARDDLEAHLLEKTRLLRGRERLLDPGIEQRNDRR